MKYASDELTYSKCDVWQMLSEPVEEEDHLNFESADFIRLA